MIATKKLLSVLFTGAIVASATAADYYVATTGSDSADGSATTPFATIDKAIITATSSDDVIHVAPGTYSTTTQWGPNLTVKLIGTGTSRDAVVIQSDGTYRTLRMAAGSWLENVTVVGEGTWKADRGGAIEMFGGTVTNCVIRDGKATAKDRQAGGNLYVNADTALVVDCEISGGEGKNHGGSVCLLNGTIRACTITGGVSYDDGEKYGANIYMQNGLVDSCTVSGGDGYEGGEIYMTGGTVTNCTILANGITRGSGGGVYMTGGTVVDCEIDGTDGTMSYYGGCIYVKNGTVRKTRCTNGTVPSGRYGGNIYIENGTVDDCTISDGTGGEGGEIYMTGGTVTNCTILANGVTTGSGGGIYMTNGTITDCEIDGADGTMSWHGGCIYMKNGTVRNTICRNGTCTFANNRSGGNVYMENGTLENVTLLNGTSGGDGGNLYMARGTASGLVCENGRAGGDGGNVRASNATISDASFSDGTIATDAEKKGANIYIDGTSKLIRCHMSGGTIVKADGVTAGYDGGSVCSWNASTILEDCLVEGASCGGILLGTTGNLYGTTIVNNNKYGIWSWKALQVFQNCVIFGNYNGDPATAREYAGNQPSGDGSAFLNCAMASGTLSTTTYPTLVTISASDFADYANGDYRPAAEGKLVDAGAADERADASMTDLDGNPRLSDLVDIGCYEYQHTDMTVSFTAPTLDVGYAPATATFTASAENAPGDVAFDVDFGDGTIEEWQTAEISHVYTASGTYTISVTAVSGVERSKPMTRTVKIVDKIQRVGEGGYATIQAALDEAVAGCEVILAAGVYEVSSPIVVNKAVTVSGEGSVVVRNTAEATSGSANHRVMEVSGGALVAGLVIESGSVFNAYGGCIDVTTATVSNCVIRGGTATRGDTGNVGGAGVNLHNDAVLTHCKVTGNIVNGTSTGSGDISGGAIFIPNGQKRVRILNTLVVDNRYVCSEGVDARSGAAGILFGGANENSLVENCTIVANTVEGALSNDSAALHCTSWSVTFRNNAIAGNFETAKGESGTYTSAKIDTAHCNTSYMVTDDVNPLNANCFVSTIGEMFKNFARGDYSPKPKGSLFDVGTTPSVPSAVDLTGKPRVMFAGIDVGCFECQRKLGFTVSIR